MSSEEVCNHLKASKASRGRRCGLLIRRTPYERASGIKPNETKRNETRDSRLSNRIRSAMASPRAGSLPQYADSWNERLIEAFEARANEARAHGKSSHFVWKRNADKIRAVRDHIYQQEGGANAGRILHLPKDLSTTGENTARAIINGQQPVLTPNADSYARGGAHWVDPESVEPQYLSTMEGHKGGYGILMAFHKSGKFTMGKKEIQQRAQPYSHDDMDDNIFHGGPGWKSIKTLEK